MKLIFLLFLFAAPVISQDCCNQILLNQNDLYNLSLKNHSQLFYSIIANRIILEENQEVIIQNQAFLFNVLSKIGNSSQVITNVSDEFNVKTKNEDKILNYTVEILVNVKKILENQNISLENQILEQVQRSQRRQNVITQRLTILNQTINGSLDILKRVSDRERFLMQEDEKIVQELNMIKDFLIAVLVFLLLLLLVLLGFIVSFISLQKKRNKKLKIKNPYINLIWFKNELLSKINYA